jgi:hypothetical protein
MIRIIRQQKILTAWRRQMDPTSCWPSPGWAFNKPRQI